MKKISVYTKTGNRAATTYYRIYQYLKDFPGEIHYHKMLSDKMYMKVMPIYTKPLHVKIIVFIYTYFRVLFQLLSDLIWKPDVIILSRRFINRLMPLSYKLILNRFNSKGTQFFWDIDDNIIETKEVRKVDFYYLSDIANTIIVAGINNKLMLHPKYQNKAIILSTTDGDMYSKYNIEIQNWRLEKYKTTIYIIWVGTSVSLEYVEKICPQLERAADLLHNEKELVLKVISNLPLKYKSSKFKIINIKWERDIAINEMLHSHIGIMPLSDSIKNQGKGGFKLIQYLSVGLPVIGSDIGINDEIIDETVGFKTETLTSNQWSDAVNILGTDAKKWLEFSTNSFEKWNNIYSFNRNLRTWQNLLSKK